MAMLLRLTLLLNVMVFWAVVVVVQAQNMTDILHSKESIVERLAAIAARAYRTRCSNTCESCVLSACSSPKPEETTVCTTLFGATVVERDGCEYDCTLRKLDYSTSNILMSPRQRNKMEEVEQESCWTDEITQQFVHNHENDTRRSGSGSNELRWQYFSSNGGLTRLFPAHTLSECYVLDPVIRPWYVAATSGPKNVIIILDVSASMLNDGRLGLAQEAVTTVIETLTNVDFATIVLFSESAEQLLIADQTAGTLLQASYANITKLSEKVSTISGNPTGGTNFEAAFTKAFDILDENSNGPNFTNCSTALLFLTDGFPNKGSTSQDHLIGMVRLRNSKHDATIFTYTFGSNSGGALARGIACETNGVYTQINERESLRDQLSLYYDYFALLRQTDNVKVAWVEPYLDAVGAGLLVSASKAIYDELAMPPKLVGVVGVDILVSDLIEAFSKSGMDYQDVISFLASRNACPRIQQFNETVLDIIRVRGGGQPCQSDESLESISGINSTPDSCTSLPRASFCNFEYQRYSSDSDTYREESCCFNESMYSSSCENGASSVYLPAGELITLTISMLFCAQI